MNLRDLKYFVTVASTRHFGRAAELCFVSQPTLSGQIRKLEDELGVILLERTNRSVALTPAGKELLPRAQRVIREADALAEMARAYNDPLAGSLRLGVIPTLGPYLMPFVLAPLGEACPQMRLVLSEEITDRLIERLVAHEIDAALIATTVDHPGLESRTLFDEPFWLALPVNSEYYNLESPFTPEQLAQMHMLLLTDGHCLASQVRDVCQLAQDQNVGDLADLRASSLEMLLQLVGAGFGCTLIPALALRGNWMSDSGVVVKRLGMENGYRRISMVWRRSYPRQQALDALGDVILSGLPNTVSAVAVDAA